MRMIRPAFRRPGTVNSADVLSKSWGDNGTATTRDAVIGMSKYDPKGD